jgi:8-oxo-dGTP diphosphatase
MIPVVCAIITRSDFPGYVLLARRSPGRTWPKYFEFPGGKVEPNETDHNALLRELEEELHLKHHQVRIGELVAENPFHGSEDGPALVLKAFQVQLTPDALLPGELGRREHLGWPLAHLPAHDWLEWVGAHNLLNYPMPPADIPIAEVLSLRG